MKRKKISKIYENHLTKHNDVSKFSVFEEKNLFHYFASSKIKEDKIDQRRNTDAIWIQFITFGLNK